MRCFGLGVNTRSKQRRGGVTLLCGGIHLCLKLLQHRFVAQIHAERIQTALSIQITRQRQSSMHFALRVRSGIERALQQIINAHVFVYDLVYE